MRAEGLEPTRISPQAPKTCASANSATPALPAFCRNCRADANPLTRRRQSRPSHPAISLPRLSRARTKSPRQSSNGDPCVTRAAFNFSALRHARHGIEFSTLSKWLHQERLAHDPPVNFQEVALPTPGTRWAVYAASMGRGKTQGEIDRSASLNKSATGRA